MSLPARLPPFLFRPGSFLKTFGVVFVLTATVLAVKHRDFYFHRAVVPWGDFAANTLSIENAKQGQEIYGNYSRWRFNHPGLAFFYVQALGETAFFDILPICPAPHNAHAFSIMLAQAAFWALAAAMLTAHVPTIPHLALIVAAGWFHFHYTGHAFVSAWPPHTLLMPFVCYAIACASVASGRWVHLAVLVPTGLLLIHNHVAQPLPVSLLALAPLGRLAWGLPQDEVGWTEFCGRNKWAYATSLGVTLLLLLPVVLDVVLYRGESNLAAILRHLQHHGEDTKSLREACLYFLEFSRYWGFHDLPDGTFRTKLVSSLLWGAACLFSLCHAFWWAPRTPVATVRQAYVPWLRAVGAIAVLAVISGVLWGMRISGPMFAFNAFYFYAVYFLVVVLSMCVLADHIGARAPRLATGLACLSLVGALMLPTHPVLSDSPNGGKMASTVDRYCEEGVIDPSRPIILTPSAERGLESVTFGHILEQKGIQFSVPESWTFVFGRRFALSHMDSLGQQPVVLSLLPPRLSHLFPDAPPIVEGTPWGVLVKHMEQITIPSQLTFDATLGPLTAGLMWDHSNYMWSIGYSGDLLLPVSRVEQDVMLDFEVEGISGPLDARPRRLEISVEGSPTVRAAVSERTHVYTSISKTVWNKCVKASGVVPIHLTFKDPISPKQVGINDDPRQLSIAFYSLSFKPAEGPRLSQSAPLKRSVPAASAVIPGPLSPSDS